MGNNPRQQPGQHTGKPLHGTIAVDYIFAQLMSDALTLTSLPLFPLGAVLFPGGLLPLRIFEVRYLDMIGKCHKAGAPFGVVALTQGSEVRKPGVGPSGDGFANEDFHAVGTLARIAHFSAPHPGLMVIRCSGAQRFVKNSSTAYGSPT